MPYSTFKPIYLYSGDERCGFCLQENGVYSRPEQVSQSGDISKIHAVLFGDFSEGLSL